MSANESGSDTKAQSSELVHVALGARSYDILVGDDLLSKAGVHIAPLLGLQRTIVISDENVAPLFSDRVVESLARHGIDCDSIVLAPGEGSKSFKNFEALLERLLACRVERGMTLLALGGGVVGDLAGFAASVLLRGMDVIQLPTSLLALIDSSEMVKYGLIDDLEFFVWLEEYGSRIMGGDAAARQQAIAHSCRAKARIISEDEQENGRRALLNLGHTFAHAFEAECGYGDALLHGEAVSIGIVLAFRLSHRLGLCSEADVENVSAHLAAHGLPTEATQLPPTAQRREALLLHMRHDKKIKDGRVHLILTRGIGGAFLASDVEPQEIAATLDDFLSVADGS